MPQILVVEDHDDIREMMAELLRIQGYDVLEAENGQRALDLLDGNTRHPDVMLLDIAMPVMSGEELLEVMDERGLLPGLPVVVISASSSPAQAQRARLFMKKPPDLQLLLEKVREFCAESATT